MGFPSQQWLNSIMWLNKEFWCIHSLFNYLGCSVVVIASTFTSHCKIVMFSSICFDVTFYVIRKLTEKQNLPSKTEWLDPKADQSIWKVHTFFGYQDQREWLLTFGLGIIILQGVSRRKSLAGLSIMITTLSYKSLCIFIAYQTLKPLDINPKYFV
jgi:hypothetical protein